MIRAKISTLGVFFDQIVCLSISPVDVMMHNGENALRVEINSISSLSVYSRLRSLLKFNRINSVFQFVCASISKNRMNAACGCVGASEAIVL